MSREDQFAARMEADATLMAILTGGVYVYGETDLGGITRESTPDAFDSNGWLQPCALVKQRSEVPDGGIDDEIAQIESTIQIVELWFYQDSGYAAIDSARARSYTLFKGYQFSDTFPISLAFVVDRQHDAGSLNGASVARMDWQVNSILSGG